MILSAIVPTEPMSIEHTKSSKFSCASILHFNNGMYLRIETDVYPHSGVLDISSSRFQVPLDATG